MQLDLFDISGLAAGLWIADIEYGNKATTNTATRCSYTQDPATNQGRYMYYNGGPALGIGALATQSFYRFDMKNRVQEPFTFLRVPLTAPTVNGTANILTQTTFIDGNTKLSFIYFEGAHPTVANQLFFAIPIIR